MNLLWTVRSVWRLLELYGALLGERKASFVAVVVMVVAGAALDGVGIALTMPLIAALQGDAGVASRWGA